MATRSWPRLLRRAALWGAVLVLVAFAAIQAVPYGRAHDNPPVTAEPQWDTPVTRQIAAGACFDCHSNETKWPWYTNIAPVSWWTQGHVDEGRAALNFSEWDRPGQEVGEAAETVSEGSMPPWYYYAGRPWAKLKPDERVALVRGLLATLGGETGTGRNGERGGEDGDE